jgi:glutamate dehydrogenase
MLENMGVTVLDDRPYEIRTAAGSVWIHAFRLRHNEAQGLDTDQVRAKFQEAFALVWAGVIDNDGFNRLVLRARLDAYEILVLRAYARYLRQIGMTYSQSYVEDCLAGHADIARALIGLFDARFDPRRKARAARVSGLAADIEEALEATTSLDEDGILRGFLTVIQATLRTNWFQRGPNGERKFHLALKLDPGLIPKLPRPIPMFEAFVCSADVDAVHLRGGQVARGGIRWSDRREDFRTEVLGLMKAQRVKNVVIVPVGATGGFIVKAAARRGGARGLAPDGRALLPDLHPRAPGRGRQPGGPADRVAPPDRALRRGRPLSGGGGRQGHRDLFRHRQRARARARVLARGRLRLRVSPASSGTS